MKVLTIESLRTFLDELERRYGKETYSKQEIDEKMKSCGTSIDLKDIAERIPNFRHWLRIKQSPHQTITATCEGKEYTADVLIEKGKTVTLVVKADIGYIAGTLSKTELTITEDTEITVTEARESDEFEAGSLEIKDGKTQFWIPHKVHVLQALFGSERKYIKVNPGEKVYFRCIISKGGNNTFILYYLEMGEEVTYTSCKIWEVNEDRKSNKNIATISWSKEINEHATDIDFTRIS